MFRLALSLLMVSYLCLPNIGTAKTFTSQQDGDWHDLATWGEINLPGPADSVLIDGHDISLSGNSVSIAYLKITNLSGSNANMARLYINASITISVSGDVDVIAENVDQEVVFKQSSTSIFSIDGNFTMARVNGNTQSKALKLELGGDSRFHITQDFNYNYNGGSESGYEIYAVGNAQFIVDGAVNFTQNSGSPFLVIIAGNALLDFNNDFNIDASGGSGIEMSLSALADLEVAQNLLVKNSGATQAKLSLATGGKAIIEDDVTIQSTSSNREAFIELSGLGSMIKITGDLTFSALTSEDVSLNISGGSNVYLGGILNRPTNYGTLTMTDDDHFYFNGTASQTIPKNSLAGAGVDSLAFTNLIFDNTAGVTLSGDLIIKKDLELSTGIIQTSDAALMIVADGATITGGSNTAYIDGPLVKRGSTNGSNFIFPIGNNGQYAPIEMGAVSASNTEYKAKYTGCPPPVGHLANNTPLQSVTSAGYWDLERADGAAVGDIILHWSDAQQVGITDLSTVVVAYLESNTTGWFSLGQSAPTGGVGSGVSGSIAIGCPPPVGSSRFAIGSTELGALPVELIKFNAVWNKANDQVNLYWETGSEVNSDHFLIEKSTDGFSFEAIEEVPAANNSSTTQYYSSVDKAPQKGNNYYRIMSVDQDRMMSFSKTINVFIKELEELPVAYPNPADNYVRVYSKALENQEVEVEVFMTNGRRIYRNRHRAISGHLYLLTDQLNMERAGTYLLTYKDQGNVYTMPITKKP